MSMKLPDYEMDILYLGVQNFAQVNSLLEQTGLAGLIEHCPGPTPGKEISSFDVIISEFAETAPPPSPSVPCIALVDKSRPEQSLQLVLSGYHYALEVGTLEYLPQALISACQQKKYRAESQQAERIMLLSERRYRRLFEAAHDPILVLNGRNQRIVDANPEILKLLGMERREAIGQTLPSLVSIDPLIWTPLIRCGEPHKDQRLGVTITSRQGEKAVVDISVSKFEEGSHAILQVSLKDITLQHQQHLQIKRQLTELTASEERFRVLSNQSPTPTLVVDIPTGRIDFANIRAQALTNGQHYLADAIGSPRAEEILQTISECGVLIDYPLRLPQQGELLVNGELSQFQNSPVAHLVLAEKLGSPPKSLL